MLCLNEIQKLLTTYIKENLPLVKKLYYFSDGCAGQYKNYKNFLNLCNHSKDFGLQAEWIFFATSHGKSPCDGIGGTVKRTTAKASLQRTTSEQILTVDAMYAFFKAQIKSIEFILIEKETMIALRESLIKRFETAVTVPGARSYHHYAPTSETSISFKRTSEDTEFLNFNLVLIGCAIQPTKDITIETLKEADFVACRYDTFWWIGIINEVDQHNK